MCQDPHLLVSDQMDIASFEDYRGRFYKLCVHIQGSLGASCEPETLILEFDENLSAFNKN